MGVHVPYNNSILGFKALSIIISIHKYFQTDLISVVLIQLKCDYSESGRIVLVTISVSLIDKHEKVVNMRFGFQDGRCMFILMLHALNESSIFFL